MKTAQERQFEANSGTRTSHIFAELTARVQEIDAAVKKNDFESKTDKPGLTKDIGSKAFVQIASYSESIYVARACPIRATKDLDAVSSNK